MRDAGSTVGILAWENELVQYPGNLIHSETFNFPVHVERVPGACFETVVKRPNDDICERFVDAARRAESKGAHLLVSTTGLSVLFQKRIADAVRVPVITSSLVFVPVIQRLMAEHKKIGVITAGVTFLSERHLQAAGVERRDIVAVGLDEHKIFEDLAINPARLSSSSAVEAVAVQLARRLVAKEPGLGMIVIEVTGLTVAAHAIRKATGLAVIDVVECALFVLALKSANRWHNH